MKVQAITSLQNPRVKAVAKLRDSRGRRSAGLFVAEGRREVSRAAAAGLTMQEFWVCPAMLGLQEPLDISDLADAFGVQPSTAVFTVSEVVFGKLAYVREPEGVLAVCAPPIWTGDQLPGVGAGTLDLVAVGTEKPGNLGAMVRSADAAGCRCVVAAGAPVDAMNPNAIRASTAAVFRMPTLTMGEDEAINYYQKAGVRLIAAYPEQGRDYTGVDYTGPVALVVGPEDRGLSPAWRDAAEATGGACVRIAMAGRAVDSLNASVAAGVLLFEAVRQRNAAGIQ
ncbi:MAG: RNA methyltransferase [Planctomycetota bacterium]